MALHDRAAVLLGEEAREGGRDAQADGQTRNSTDSCNRFGGASLVAICHPR